MGVVFLAAHPALARTVAIKILHPSLEASRLHMRRFCHEAVAASQVKHPQVATVIDCGCLTDGTPYIVMEHIRGCSLSKLEHVTVPRAIELVGQILEILGTAHASGVIHGDIKSDNVIVDDADSVRLIDFGLARVDGKGPADELIAKHDVVAGTPEYMAPELGLGHLPTPASDLYAVGVILYELLTGKSLFDATEASALVSCHIDEAIRSPSLRCPERGISSQLDRVVLRALDKQPQARFKDAAEFARALAVAAAGTISIHVRCRACGNDVETSARFCSSCGVRLAEEVERSHSDSESPTRNVTVPPQRRLARGSQHMPNPVEDARRAIGIGLVLGDPASISEGYLTLGATLAKQGRLAEALSELAEGIDVLTKGGAPGIFGAEVQLLVEAKRSYERTHVAS